MNISKFCVNRPVTTLMFMLIIIVLGFVSFTQIQLDLYPDMDIPVSITMVQYPNTSPEEIENLVTKPIESQIATAENLKGMTSISREGMSLIIAEFEYGTDMNFASLEMREKVALISGFLPENASDPMVFKLNPQMMPIMEIEFSSNKPLSELYTLVDKEINPRLERINGVASAELFGGLEKEIVVKIDQEKLSGYNLNLAQIASTIKGENINLPSGNVRKGSKDLLVRTIGEFESLNDINNIPIMLPTGENILLSDIAYIQEGYKKQDSISRVNGIPSVAISITKQSTANTVTTADNILKTLYEIETQYPDIQFSIGFNQAEFINKSVSNVATNAIIGGILAILVLFIFLRNIRSTSIIAIAIPISVITTFALMYFNNMTLNIISLGGLSLGIGMLVDNSIVVLENIYRLREDGLSRNDASINGAREVMVAIFASTMTTIAVFLPIVFVKGFTAILFKELSLTVTFSLLASFVIAITVVPMLCSKFLTVSKVTENPKRKYKFKMLSLFAKLLETVSKEYIILLNKALGMRKRIIAFAVILFIVSLSLIGIVGGELFPSADEGSFTVTIETPFGTTLEETDELISQIEQFIMNISEVDTCTVSIGATSMMSMTNTSNTSTLRVNLIDIKERNRSTSKIANEVREELQNMVGVKTSITESSQSSGGTGATNPISIEIKGDSLETLNQISEDFKEILRSINGTIEVSSNVEEGNPEVRVYLDRQKSAFYGVTAYQLATTLQSSLSGDTASQYKVNGEEIDITLSLNTSSDANIEEMRQILIQAPTGQYVSVGQIADLEYDNSPSQITREDQVRTVTVTSQLLERDLRSASNEIAERLDSYPMPFGYSFDMGGQQQDMEEAFGNLFLALLLSIVLIYMILASQFESLLQPFIIMMSVPFAFTGAFLGLFITGTPLSLPAYIGLIVLAGIVVNNAIVLIDFINQQRKAGTIRKEAIINAGKFRLRPILMTMLTTVLGLTPLSIGIGEGSEIMSPMGISVIGGLSFSTLITLIFIPVLYSILDDLSMKIQRKSKTAGE